MAKAYRITSILGAVAVIALLLLSSVEAFGSQAVAYQIDPAHTGSQSDGLTQPLVQHVARSGTELVDPPLAEEAFEYAIWQDDENKVDVRDSVVAPSA